MFASLLFIAFALRPVVALLSNGVIFPLYIYPDLVFNDGCTQWTSVFTAITTNPTLPFLIVVNPNSGPGDNTDTNYQTCITKLKSFVNVETIGYVRTNYTVRASSEVIADISAYASWDASYRPSGIFFDETLATTEAVSIYESYASAVHSSLGSSAFVTFNPGVVPVDDFYAFSDLIVSAEVFYSDFSASQLTISTAAPGHKQSVILHDGPSTTPVSLVNQLSSTLDIAYIFITNFAQDIAYENIPSDFANFCKDVAAAQA